MTRQRRVKQIDDSVFVWTLTGCIAGVIFCLAFWVAVFYVILHFLAKVW